jgi:orotidine-5'-phosphate decarboxylase
VKTLKGVCGSDFLTIVPGVRLGNDVQDQRRVVTPYEAASVGADYIVMGRDITGAPDMLAAVEAVEEQIGRAIRRACT